MGTLFASHQDKAPRNLKEEGRAIFGHVRCAVTLGDAVLLSQSAVGALKKPFGATVRPPANSIEHLESSGKLRIVSVG
jgi:hypothetical protein